MFKLIGKKVKASMLETMVAGVILVTMFVIGFAVIVNINMAPSLFLANKAKSEINKLLHASIEDKNYQSQSFTVEGLTIEKEVDLDHDKHLVYLSFVARDVKDRVVHRKSLIILNKKEYFIDE